MKITRLSNGVAVLTLLGVTMLPRTLLAQTSRVLAAATSTRAGACTLLELMLARPARSVVLVSSSSYTDVLLRLDLTDRAQVALEERGIVPRGAAGLVRSIAIERAGPSAPMLRLTLTEPMQVQVDRSTAGDLIALRLAPISSVDCAELPAAVAPVPAASNSEDLRAAQLEVEAEAAIREQNFGRASAALAESLARPENLHSPRARELMAVVHERSGNRAQARDLYEDYLHRYPRGEGANRVRQRLAALDPPFEALAAPQREAAGAWHTEVRGASSQFYLRDSSRSDFLDATDPAAVTATDRRNNVDELLSSADFTLSAAGPRTRIEAHAAGAYVAEHRPVVLVGSDRQQGSYSMLYDRWLSVTNEGLGLMARVGRQTRFGDGIFGRFDGTLVGWNVAPRLRLNAFTGHPVVSARATDTDNTRTFQGVSAEIESASTALWASFHWLEQHTEGLLDRRSLGAQLKLKSRQFTFGSLLDYDIYFDGLNAAYLNANYGFDDGSTLALSSELVHYPTLGLSNAIIGQPIPTLDAVRETYDLDALEQLARDRTMDVRSTTVTYSRSLGPTLQLIGDASVARSSDSPESAGVPAYPGSGTERFLGLQLIGTGLPRNWILGLRAAALQFADVRSADVTARLAITPRFSITPQLQLVSRAQRFDSGWSHELRLSGQFLYDFTAHAQLDASVGGHWVEQRLDGPAVFGDRDESALIGHIGFRVVF